MTWEIWIKSNDCFDLLMLCAKSIMRKYNWLISEVMELGDNPSQAGDSNDDNGASLDVKQFGDEYELVNDIWMYLQEGANSVNLQDYILRDDIGSFKNHLMYDFVNHLKDIRRQSSDNKPDSYRSFRRNPRCHYYRNACEVFRDEKKQNRSFQYGHSKLSKAFYAYTAAKLPIPPQDIVSTLEYASWPYPQEYLAPEQIFKSASILKTSKLFWDETQKPDYLGGPFLIPVWELTSYVFSHVKVDAEFVTPPVLTEGNEGNDLLLPDPGTPPDQMLSVVKLQLNSCAIRAASSWDSEVRKSFLLKFFSNLTLRELKSEGIASPQHRVDQARIAIRDAWLKCYEEQEGVFSVDSESEELFMFFCECLETACKKLQDLENCACGIAESWHPDIHKAYNDIFYNGISIEELAAKGMASPEHRLYQAVNQIRNAWTLWYGECTDLEMENPDNEGYFEFFCNKLAEFRKKHDHRRLNI